MSHSNRPPSIRDIARQCGVSPGTVSNVINGRDVVKPETASRIRALMNELNYLPQSKAVNTNRVMLLIPPHRDALLSSYSTSIHAGICEAAFNANIVLSMQRCPKDLKSANQLRDMLREDGSTGVILMASTPGYHLSDTLALSQTPHIVVGASRHHENINQIVLDDQTSAYRATRYLQSLGHRRISMIYFNRADMGHAQRHAGFVAASKHLKIDPALIDGVEVKHTQPQEGADALAKLM
ncbi:MAG: LacI family DNA-binding transcriptional regulator, partial [Phycisphaeraceae bacterium]|nr:LacI family DNA-binding transcriptional regulator [Phycisphaeraceae bacterium]